MTNVLVLNFSYESLGVTTFERAVRLLFAGKAEMVAPSDREIASPSFAMRLPSIVRMLYYIKRPRARVGLTKKNVLLRDDYACQYCGTRERTMTVDHVLPKSRGGADAWENLACACVRCNGRKNDRTPAEAGMTLRRKPREPRFIPWLTIKRNTMPAEWGKYLFLYDVGIEERIE